MWLAISWTSFDSYKKKHKELSSRWPTCWNNATKLSSLEGSCPGGQEEKHQPSIPSKPPVKTTPSFQVRRIQFTGYNFHILRKSPGVKQIVSLIVRKHSDIFIIIKHSRLGCWNIWKLGWLPDNWLYGMSCLLTYRFPCGIALEIVHGFPWVKDFLS